MIPEKIRRRVKGSKPKNLFPARDCVCSGFAFKIRFQVGGRFVGLFRIQNSPRVALLSKLFIENGGELLFNSGVSRVGSEIGHFKMVLGCVIELFRRTIHEAVDEFFVLGI